MTEAVFFALLSLCFAGVNDVAFKRYSAKHRSRGMLVSGIGAVWLVLQTVTLFSKGQMPQIDTATLEYGAITGIALTASNILFIESLAHIEVALGSTIYRLNTVGVAVLSIVFLQESAGYLKISGILIGVVAVVMLAKQPCNKPDARHGAFIWLAMAASALRAVYGVVSKQAITQGADIDTMLIMTALSWAVGGVLYATLREGRFRITGTKAAYALFCGLLVYLIVNFLIAAIARGEASTVIPIANLSFIAAMLISAALRMERLTYGKCGALGFAVASIWLLSGK